MGLKRALERTVVKVMKGVPEPVYERLKRMPVVAPLLKRGLDATLDRKGFSEMRVEGGPLEGYLLELQPRVNKDMIVGRYEPELMARVETAIPNGGTAFDVGAHLGYATLVMARRAGEGGRVAAFEPDPVLADILVRNVDRNQGPAEITVVPSAVGRSRGSAAFHRGTSTGIGRVIADGGDLEVRVTALDDAVDDIAVPDVVKIDVEGGESDVLLGASRLLELRRTTFFVEAHSDDLADRCAALLDEAGYEVERLHEARAATTHLMATPRTS